MSVEDLLGKASSVEHVTKGDDLQAAIDEARMTLLSKYYLKGLSEAEKSKFRRLEPFEQAEKLRKENYIIKKEHAEELAEDIALYVVKRHSPEIAKELEKNLKVLRSSASDEKKAEARRQIDFIKPSVANVGYDWDTLVKEAGEKGFSAENYAKGTANVGRGYTGSYQRAYLNMAKEPELHAHLEKVGKPMGFKTDVIKGKGIDEVKGFLLGYQIAKKRGPEAVDAFKKDQKHYLK